MFDFFEGLIEKLGVKLISDTWIYSKRSRRRFNIKKTR